MEKGAYSLVLVGLIMLLVGSGMLMGHGLAGFGMGLGFALMILFWLAVIWLIAGLVKEQPDKDSLEILKERYANGKITKKKFHQIKKEIV